MEARLAEPRRMLLLVPADAAACNQLAQTHYHGGCHDAAARWFQRMAATAPAARLEGQLNACLALCLTAQPDAAERCLGMLAKLLTEVSAPAALDLIAQCASKALDAAADDRRARIVWERLLTIGPGETATLLLGARLARRSQDGGRSRRLVQRHHAANSNAEAHMAAAATLKGLLPSHEVLALFRRIICASPGHAGSFAHASDLAGRQEAAESGPYARRVLALAPPADPLVFQVATNLATSEYLADRPDAAHRLLLKYPSHAAVGADPAAARILAEYLGRLIAWHGTTTPPIPPHAAALYYVGDSHSLSAQGAAVLRRDRTYRVQALCFPGQTMRSLARGIGVADIAERLRKLPGDTPLIFGFGEVDCRPAGHLMTILRLEGATAMRRRVNDIVAEVVHRLQAVASPCRVIGCVGVPTPNLAALEVAPHERDTFRSVSTYVNEVLAGTCHSSGLVFIDSSLEPGAPETGYHIDGHHLTPGAMAGVLRRGLSEA